VEQFGPLFAAGVRRQRVSRMRGFRHWRWHLDEMYVKLNGEMVYLWRAVDQEGEILESYVTRKRDKFAALAFMKKALKRHGSPEAITTDGLRSYRAAMDDLGNGEKQEIGRPACGAGPRPRTVGWRRKRRVPITPAISATGQSGPKRACPPGTGKGVTPNDEAPAMPGQGMRRGVRNGDPGMASPDWTHAGHLAPAGAGLPDRPTQWNVSARGSNRMRHLTIPVLACALLAAATAAPARDTPGPIVRTYVYTYDSMDAALLPADLVSRRKADRLLDACRLADTVQLRVDPILIPLVGAIANMFLTAVEQEIQAREKKRLASLSHTYSGNASFARFPLEANTNDRDCLVVDSIEVTGAGSELGSTRDIATYVVGMSRVGDTAFRLEPLGARIDSSKALPARERARTLNAEVSLAFTAVAGRENSQLPELYSYPAYTFSLKNMIEGQNHGASELPRSIVMPLPQTGASSVPVTIAAAVTESHTTLNSEKERIALEQSHRKALITASGEMLKAAMTAKALSG
jgi:hypothetical protein